MIGTKASHLKTAFALLSASLLLSGCDSLAQAFGTQKIQEPGLPGERIAVLSFENDLQEDTSLQDEQVNVISPLINADFVSETALQQNGIDNIRASGFHIAAQAEVGDGNAWQTQLVAQPIIGDNILFAVDAYGVVTAHNAENIEEILWRKQLNFNEDLDEIEGGGLTYYGGVVYITTGYGGINALLASDGSLLWRQEVGTPIRSAPAVEGNMLYTITIDNELLAFSSRTGQPLWTHRGIRESTVYLGDVPPVAENGIVLAPYSSGELYALRSDDGSPLWSDNLITTKRTSASAALTGIDATPLVRGNLLYAVSNNGLMVANVLSNGRGLWDMELSSYHTPWIAGDYLFILTSDMRLIALHARSKRIKWITDLQTLVDDGDELPRFSAPIMLNSSLALTGDEGQIWMFDPEDGYLTDYIDIPENIHRSPIASNGSLYLIDADAQLYQLK